MHLLIAFEDDKQADTWRSIYIDSVPECKSGHDYLGSLDEATANRNVSVCCIETLGSAKDIATYRLYEI